MREPLTIQTKPEWKAAAATAVAPPGAGMPARRGRKPLLNADQRRAVLRLLTESAERHGFESGEWTRRRVQIVVSRTFGVELSLASITGLMSEIGASARGGSGSAVTRAQTLYAPRQTGRDTGLFDLWSEHASEVVLRYDAQLRLVDANPPARRLGAPDHAPFGHRGASAFVPAGIEREAFMAGLQRTVRSGIGERLLLQREDAQGPAATAEVLLLPQGRNRDGSPCGVVAVLQQQATPHGAQGDALQAVLEQLHLPAAILDGQGRLEHFNAAFAALDPGASTASAASATSAASAASAASDGSYQSLGRMFGEGLWRQVRAWIAEPAAQARAFALPGQADAATPGGHGLLRIGPLPGPSPRWLAWVARGAEESSLVDAVLSGLPMAVGRLHRDGQGRLYGAAASLQWEPLLGIHADEWQRAPMKMLDRLDPVDRLGAESVIGPALRSGQPWSIEGRVVEPAPARRWVQVRALPTRFDAADGSGCWTLVASDVSERKRSDLARAGARHVLAQLMEASSDPMLRIDRQLRCVDVNAAFVQWSGCRRDLVLGRDVALLRPGDRPDAGEGGTAGAGWSDVRAVRELLAGVFERPVTVDLMLCWGEPAGPGRYAARVIPDGGHSEEPLQTLVLHIRRERVGGWT